MIDFNYEDYTEIEKQLPSISVTEGAVDERAKLDPDIATKAPIVRALRLIIDEAVNSRASEIHLQPQEDRLRVRYRIDGILQDTLSLPLKVATPLITRVKVLANMNIADHHRPQDGQFSVSAKGRSLDVRVGTTPTVHGEMVALTLLPKTTKVAISLPEEMLNAVERERGESGENRSEFFRRAVEMLLRRRREQELSEGYTRAYQEMPETKEEVAAARRAASLILAEEPWR